MSHFCDQCRSPAHCIEYAHLIQWGQERQEEEFDADVEEHMRWVCDQATKRAAQFGIAVRRVGSITCCTTQLGLQAPCSRKHGILLFSQITRLSSNESV